MWNRTRPLAWVAALSLSGCVSDWFGDGEIPWPSHKNSEANRGEAKRPRRESRRTGETGGSDSALARASNPDSTDWEPVDAASRNAMPPPPSEGFASSESSSPLPTYGTPPPIAWETPPASPPPPPTPATGLPPPMHYSPPPPGDYQPPVPTAHGGVVSSPTLRPGHQAAGTSDKDPLYGSFVGKTPPEVATDGKWLTGGVAPSIAGLRGQVVFLLFAFQSCPSCAQLTPYLKQWHEMYGPQGLSVVYVNNGRMSDEATAKNGIRDQGLRFPYFHDKDGSTIAAFGVRAFPAAYVVDRSGKVVWEGTPLAVESQVQDLIVGLLR